jgi:hypothetical protein
MALDRNKLRNDIIAFLDAAAEIKDPDAQKTHFADSLSDAVDRYVRAAQVTGVKVDVAGVTAQQTGEGVLS